MHKLHPIRESFESRFWKYVLKTDGCWLWTGFLDRNQRGHIRLGRATEGHIQSSRASWILNFGPIPKGKFVLHHCDNPKCVRPDHLYIGTQADNMRDVRIRGRHYMKGKGFLVSGSQNPNSRLNWESVGKIRKAAQNGTIGSKLAAIHGVTKECIYHIIHNRTWKK